MKRQFLYQVRTNQPSAKQVNILSFMNFKRTLSENSNNISLMKHNVNRLIAKHFFHKKKKKPNVFFKRTLNYNFVTYKHLYKSFTCVNTYNSRKEQKLGWKYTSLLLKFSRINFKNYLISLRVPRFGSSQYFVLKWQLKHPPRFKKKISILTKKVKRKIYRQVKYTHVFLRKIKRFFKKNRRTKKKFFFCTK